MSYKCTNITMLFLSCILIKKIKLTTQQRYQQLVQDLEIAAFVGKIWVAEEVWFTTSDRAFGTEFQR